MKGSFLKIGIKARLSAHDNKADTTATAVPANKAAVNCSELGLQNRSFVQQDCGAHEWRVSKLSATSLIGWNVGVSCR